MAFTFPVDDVTPATTRLATRSVAELHPEAISRGGDATAALAEAGDTHALLQAVHLAFSEHRPLVLTPDAVWLTIAQGFAQHLRLNAEALRGRFVRHDGRKPLVVRHPELALPTDFAPIIHQFRALLAQELGAGVANLVTCDFSTTTDLERTASEIVLMDAFQAYFEYILMCICGIPRVTVTGTPADWRKMGERLRVLGEYDLAWWTGQLEPICEQLARAAEGRPDRSFFARIYKPKEAYGGDRVTGWIARLYPYLRGNTGAFDRRNPLLSRPESDPDVEHGIGTTDAPTGLSSAPLRVMLGEGATLDLDLVGGFLGIAQDPADGTLTPQVGWFVRPAGASMSRLLGELGGELLPPAPPRRFPLEGPAEVLCLYSLCDGGTLFSATGRPWRLRPTAELGSTYVSRPHERGASLTAFCDLPDGSVLAYARERHNWTVVQLPPGSTRPTPAHDGIQPLNRIDVSCPLEEMVVVAGSVTEVLARGLATGGAPPIESAPQPRRTMSDLLSFSALRAPST